MCINWILDSLSPDVLETSKLFILIVFQTVTPIFFLRIFVLLVWEIKSSIKTSNGVK